MSEVHAEMVASVLQIVAQEGDRLSVGDTLVILESMKMEIPVIVEQPGTLRHLAVDVGTRLQEGDLIAVLDTGAPA